MILVSYIRVVIAKGKFINGLLKDDQELEILWTVIPFVVLLFLAVPSLKILYYMDEVNHPAVSLQAVGHQWYWTYTYFLPHGGVSRRAEIEGRYMIRDDSDENKIRLLETEYRVVLPVMKDARVLCTSEDVLHAWRIGSLGVKVDAVPGRINQLNFMPNKPGVYYGNCMELCGAQHRFMPITLEVRRNEEFHDWLLIYYNSINNIINLRFIDNSVL